MSSTPDVRVARSVTVLKPIEEVYGFWQDFENFPRFMTHVKAVVVTGDRSHWVVAAPADTTVEWDATIVEDRPDELLSWRAVADSDVPNEGSVRFVRAPGDRGTEIHVELRYSPPAGRLGSAVAWMFGEEPNQQLRDDLRRFKQVMETGEVVLSDGSLEGAGQGASQQRAAQAPVVEARS